MAGYESARDISACRDILKVIRKGGESGVEGKRHPSASGRTARF